DNQKRITLVSKGAQKLLHMSEDDLVGKTIAEGLPDLAKVLEIPKDTPIKSKGSHEITLMVGSEERTFSVCVTEEKSSSGDIGSVVTFDDITDLLVAQRTSAWGDVARRIAHEIKNPLTPIILSAERLRRKYGQFITADHETFEKLTATIERQAKDIKTMVDEFAAFARVPKPNIEEGDLRDAVQEPVILFRESHPDIAFKLELPSEEAKSYFDRRLITQVITNLVKNGTEAIESALQSGQIQKGLIRVRMVHHKETTEITIIDNGVGLPKQNRARLLEPYVTTKGSKGTGLGLAIVQKIIEQHGGAIFLEDAPIDETIKSGALARIVLPRQKDGRIIPPSEIKDGSFPLEKQPELSMNIN
ncbi:MAG: sensor histidine kinase, partial [Hyphomicrobium sp.]